MDGPKVEYTWPTDSLIELLTAVDTTSAAEAAAAVVRENMAQLEEAARTAANGAEGQEVARLAAAHREAVEAAHKAQSLANQHNSKARSMLAEGLDPSKEEAAAAKAENQIRIFHARAAHLGKLLESARKKSHQVGVASVETVWRELIAQAGQRRADVLGRLAAAMAPLLVELLANDRSEMGLYDPNTGGPPAEVLDLLTTPAETALAEQ